MTTDAASSRRYSIDAQLKETAVTRPSGPRIAIFVVGTIALLVFYLTWRYGAGWRWVSVSLTASLTAVSLVASVGRFPKWDRERRENFNSGMAAAALALLLAMTVVDAVAANPDDVDYTSIGCAFGIPFLILLISLLIERRQAYPGEEGAASLAAPATQALAGDRQTPNAAASQE